MTDTVPIGLVVVRLTQPVKNYPVGTELGYKDVADAIAALGSAHYFEVVRDQQGNPIPPLTPEEIEEAQRAAQRRAKARRLILGADFDPLWERVDGIPSAEELEQMRDDVEAVADVPPRVEAVETQVARVTTALILDTAYPTLQAAMNAGAGGTVLVTHSQTVPPGLTIPPKTRVLVSPGVVLTRQQPTTGVWVTAGVDATIDGGDWNGAKASATAFSRAYTAIYLEDGASIHNAIVRDNNGHGIRYGHNSRSVNVRSTGHGSSAANMDGDGFYIADVLNVDLDRCTAEGNARIGITVTSNTAPVSATLRNCDAGTTNGYTHFNFERAPSTGQSVNVRVSGFTGGGGSASGARLVMEDAAVARLASGTAMAANTDITLRRVTMAPTGVDEIGAEIYARRIVLDDVQITVNRTSGWGAAFYPGEVGSAQNVTLSGTMYQGLLFSVNGGSWERIVNCGTAATATVTYPGAARRVGVRTINGGGLRFLNVAGGRFSVIERQFRGYDTAATGGGWTGTFDAGDIIENIAPAAGGSIGWVYAGGAWKAYGAIAT